MNSYRTESIISNPNPLWQGWVDGVCLLEQWLAKTETADVIVFDLDGTLVHSDYANFLSYKAAIEKVIGRQSNLMFHPHQRINRESLQWLFPELSKNEQTQIIAEKECLYLQYLPMTTVNKQVLEVLLRNQGKEIILATNSKQARAELLLAYHGLTALFTHRYYNGDVKAMNKFEKALGDLSGDWASVVVFENERKQANLACAAGVFRENIILLGEG